jgi:hypothetical protein
MKSKRSESIPARDFKALREKLFALGIQEIADLFRVSRATVYNWMKYGIDARNRGSVANYNIIIDLIAQHGEQWLMENRFSIVPNSMVRTHSRRCRVLLPGPRMVKRCGGRVVCRKGLCADHERMVSEGYSFLLLDGTVTGSEKIVPNAALPVRCSVKVVGGRRCPMVGYYSNGRCKFHQGAEYEHESKAI